MLCFQLSKIAFLYSKLNSIHTKKFSSSKMVNTKSQVHRDNRIEQSEADSFTDDDDNVADHYQERCFNENDGETMRSLERDHERLRIEQRFLDMNRQIGTLTSIVKALTEKMSNSKEGNSQDVLNSEMSTRCCT